MPELSILDVLVFWHIALNLVFNLQALWESSGREVLGLRCSELTVGLDNTSQLAGASQLQSVLLLLYFCTPSNSAWFLLMEGRHEVGFDLGHLLTANISVSELGIAEFGSGWRWKFQILAHSRTIKISALHTKQKLIILSRLLQCQPPWGPPLGLHLGNPAWEIR